jgi:hypothetical protein
MMQTVPEGISPVPTKHVAWGNHHHEGRIIESGKVTSLTEADSVEIIIEERKKKLTEQEISYRLRDQPQVDKITDRRTSAIGELRERIALAHKERPITALAHA